MKTYRASTSGRWQAGALLLTLGVIFLYSARKAWGLWRGTSAKASDPQLFQLNLNTTVPAFLLTLVALGCLGVIWYLVSALFSRVQLDDKGIVLQGPGYRLAYQWEEIAALDVLQEPEEDTTACLRLNLTRPATLPTETVATPAEPDEIAEYLSEADRTLSREERRNQRKNRRQYQTQLRTRITTPAGRSLPPWVNLFYPQVRRPDCLLLYPALADRPALIAEIEQHLARA